MTQKTDAQKIGEILGIEVPEDCEISIQFHKKPVEGEELSDTDLESVSGGTDPNFLGGSRLVLRRGLITRRDMLSSPGAGTA